jgi:hypothetical protein
MERAVIRLSAATFWSRSRIWFWEEVPEDDYYRILYYTTTQAGLFG